jgi:Uma2 family endonuclease
MRRMSAVATAELLHPEPMTLEQWADLDEDEPGELVDGWLVEEEVPTNLHEAVVSWLIRILGSWIVPKGGWVFGSEHKLAVGTKRGRKPDVTMYLPGARLRRRESLSRTPPALVVEVLSPRPRDVRRDRKEKLGEYARFGVQLYWLVDPRARLLEMFELGGGSHRLLGSVSEGNVQVPGLEGLVLDMDALWGEVNRLDGEGEDDGDVGSGEG